MINSQSEGVPYRIRFSDGQHEGFADADATKGGKNAGFRPHDLLEAALACCIAMTAEMFAEQHGIPLRQAKTMVRLNRESANEIVFEIKSEFDGELTTQQIERLRTATQACPVSKTLSKTIRFVEAP
jgi:putative redox protein